MPIHDDHSRAVGAGDEAHVLSLRLALGTILSPKRPQMTQSATTSGTASPAVQHCPHSAFPLTPAHSNSGSHPAPSPVPHHPSPHPHLHHVHAHHPQHPHYPHYHHQLQQQQQQQQQQFQQQQQCQYEPAMPGHGEGAQLPDGAHPHMPDTVAVAVTSESQATGAGGPVTVQVPIPGNMTPGTRSHFVETLQSKKSWDALIHGSWV